MSIFSVSDMKLRHNITRKIEMLILMLMFWILNCFVWNLQLYLDHLPVHLLYNYNI